MRPKSNGLLLTLTAFAALLQSGVQSHAASPESVTIAPVTPWNVDYGAKLCSLRRGFGAKDKPTILIMDRFGPTDSFQFTVVGDEFKSFQQGQPVMLRFGAQKPRRMTYVIPGRSTNKTATLFFPRVSLAETFDDNDKNDEKGWTPTVTQATEASIASVTISYPGKTRTFTTGSLAKPMDALRACTANLVESWGFDPKQQATLSAWPEPKTRPTRWIGSEDYPRSMTSYGKQAQVNFRLSIDAQGAPTACDVQSSYNDPKFDQLTCALLMRRARFEPARDANGNAIPWFYLNTVRWVMLS